MQQKYRTIESVSTGLEPNDRYELGAWAGEETHVVQALLHLEYWRSKYPTSEKHFHFQLGAQSAEVEGDYKVYTTVIILTVPKLGKRQFGTIRTVKEAIVP